MLKSHEDAYCTLIIRLCLFIKSLYQIAHEVLKRHRYDLCNDYERSSFKNKPRSVVLS